MLSNGTVKLLLLNYLFIWKRIHEVLVIYFQFLNHFVHLETILTYCVYSWNVLVLKSRKSWCCFSPACAVRSKAQQSSDISSDGEKFKPKMRSIINKTVIVDFLVNDLCFYMECERSGTVLQRVLYTLFVFSVSRSRQWIDLFWVSRFRHLADAGDIMASEGMYSENDYAMLHQKAEPIINIFLHSSLSPKLMVCYYL